MPYEIRLPNITSSDPSVQLAQTQSYLRQMAEYLNWALNTLSGETAENTNELVHMNGKPIDKEDKEAKETFERLKDLIIKSADIVYAYEHAMKITTESGSYSISDFGEHVDTMQNSIDINGSNITQVNTRTQSIKYKPRTNEETKDSYTSIITENAYIKTGWLDDSAYGIEIGKDGVKNARFTGEKLSFYTNNQEVAFVSNRQLYINNATLLGDLYIGGYIVKSDNGLAFLWKGES